MFGRNVGSEEMKSYTLLGRTDQANLRFVKDRIFGRSLQCFFYISKRSFKLNQANMQNDWEVLLISQKTPNN